MNRKLIQFDLKTPCDNCPFRKDVPLFIGIGEKLPEYHSAIERGEFMHTCHKTDKRATGYIKGYKGPVQHCAGAMIFAKKIKIPQLPMLTACEKGMMDHKELDMKAPVFESLTDLLKAYMPFLKKKIKESEIQISVRY